MSVNEKMTAIADGIRARSTDYKRKLSLDDMALSIEDVYGTGREAGFSEGYNSGWDAGEAAEHARCVEKHFATTVQGSGTTSVSFFLPFEPDFLAIFCGDSDIWGTSSTTVYGATFDLSAFGLAAGAMFVSNTSGLSNYAMSTASYKTRYSRAEDGTVTIGNIGGPSVGSFKANRPYMVCAVKYVEQTDKERITEYIRSLGDSGSVTLNQAKVNAAFTDEEWAALIAEKPGWTFSLLEG